MRKKNKILSQLGIGKETILINILIYYFTLDYLLIVKKILLFID